MSALDLHRDLVAAELTAGLDDLRNRQCVDEGRETQLHVGALRAHECAAAAEGDDHSTQRSGESSMRVKYLHVTLRSLEMESSAAENKPSRARNNCARYDFGGTTQRNTFDLRSRHTT